ncbi:protein of unknown function [Methylacidimicrobium sp. AP8]|nr:protein of unknown function [Methylacidimicrobium sp. AP8]
MAVRDLCANTHPDREAICRFRRENLGKRGGSGPERGSDEADPGKLSAEIGRRQRLQAKAGGSATRPGGRGQGASGAGACGFRAEGKRTGSP